MALQLFKFFALLGLFAATVLALQIMLNSYMTARSARHKVNRRLKLLESGVTREEVVDLLRADRKVSYTGGKGPRASFYKACGRAAIGISPPALLLRLVLVALAITALLFLVAMMSGYQIAAGTFLLLPAIGFAAGLGLPVMYVVRRAQKRSRLMEQQFPEAIDIFTRALRAGHPIGSAIHLLTTEMPDPVGSEFGIVADEVSFGLDLNRSLANFARRWDLEDINMFAVCISVQSETGGNLAEILGNLASVIRDRASLYLKVRALSSEGRMSAWMLSIMPVLTFVVLFLSNPGFYLDVAGDPLFINIFVALLFLYVIGVLWIRKMVDLKV